MAEGNTGYELAELDKLNPRINIKFGEKNYNIAKQPPPEEGDDPRLSYLNEVVSQGKTITTITEGKANSGYNYLLDVDGTVVARVSDRGAVEVPCSVPLEDIEVELWYDNKPEHHQLAESYAAKNDQTDPSLITLQGPKKAGEKIHLIHGHHRYEAAKLHGDKTIKGWVMLMKGEFNPLLYQINS